MPSVSVNLMGSQGPDPLSGNLLTYISSRKVRNCKKPLSFDLIKRKDKVALLLNTV